MLMRCCRNLTLAHSKIGKIGFVIHFFTKKWQNLPTTLSEDLLYILSPWRGHIETIYLDLCCLSVWPYLSQHKLRQATHKLCSAAGQSDLIKYRDVESLRVVRPSFVCHDKTLETIQKLIHRGWAKLVTAHLHNIILWSYQKRMLLIWDGQLAQVVTAQRS